MGAGRGSFRGWQFKPTSGRTRLQARRRGGCGACLAVGPPPCAPVPSHASLCQLDWVSAGMLSPGLTVHLASNSPPSCRVCSCLTALCWLDLGGNELSALPRSLAGLTSLETVRCCAALLLGCTVLGCRCAALCCAVLCSAGAAAVLMLPLCCTALLHLSCRLATMRPAGSRGLPL